jgi:hypothetical protein
MEVNITGVTLTQYQKDILYSPARFTITEASTKAGKTSSHLWWLLQMALEGQENECFWWVAPVYSQAKIAFDRLVNNTRASGVFSYNLSRMDVVCPNGSIISFKSSDNHDSLYGENVYACVMDEATRMKPTSWTAIRSTLTSTRGKCKLIGNFVGVSNWVHKLAEKSKVDKEYEYFKINCYDAVNAGILDLEEVEQAKKDLTDREFRELYLAEAFEGSSQLITHKTLSSIFNPLEGQEGIKYISCDVARFGSDNTVIGIFNGYILESIEAYNGYSTKETAERIKELMELNEIAGNCVVIDTDGVGGGVADLIPNCRQFHGGAIPIPQKGRKQAYRNLKIQCSYLLSEVCNEGLLRIDTKKDSKLERLIVEELEQIQSVEGTATKLDIKAKKLIKEEIKRSPDYSDMIMMRMIFDLKQVIKNRRSALA